LIDAYIFPSEFTLKYITKHFSTDRSLAFHVPSPVLPHALPNTQKNREKYFIYAGRISVEKGVFTLISTFSQSRNAHMKLKIAGDGPDAEKIRALVHNSPNITVVGKLDKQALAPLISNALAMVAPSIWYDVQPNSVLESLSYQTPVIAPAHPVFNELLGKQKRFLYKNIRQFDDILNTVWRKREKTHVSLPQIHLPNSHYAQIIAIYQQLLAHR
jgi:glycosyltransferase involved in cell wall biosynthesis